MNKKDLKQIKNIFDESFPETFNKTFEPFAISIQEEFTEAKKKRALIQKDIEKIKEDVNYLTSQLWKLEQRVAAIENILTERQKELRIHTKELQAIKKGLLYFQKKDKKKVEVGQFIILEKRVAALEAQVK